MNTDVRCSRGGSDSAFGERIGDGLMKTNRKKAKKTSRRYKKSGFYDLTNTEQSVCLILTDVFSTTPYFKAAKRLWEIGIRAKDFHPILTNDKLCIPSHISNGVYNYLRDFDLDGKPVERESVINLFTAIGLPDTLAERKP